MKPLSSTILETSIQTRPTENFPAEFSSDLWKTCNQNFSFDAKNWRILSKKRGFFLCKKAHFLNFTPLHLNLAEN